MRFANREHELRFTNEAKRLSKNKLFTLVITGLRRVGKTRLILECLTKNDIYFFVNKDKSSEGLLREYEGVLKEKNVLKELESIDNWDGFFKILFSRCKGVIAFDEFQNFSKIEKEIFGVLQKYIDINEDKKDLLLIFSGSTIGLIKKIFEDKKEPLYGRVKRKLFLKPLSFFDTAKMSYNLNILKVEDIIALYSIFGGFPKYYVAIEDENLTAANQKKILEKFFFMENAILEDEVLTILSLEFGKRRGVYYDILTAIANGSTRISEISSFLRKKESAFTRHLDELINYFEIISQEKQMIGKKKLFFIKHPLINFWFRFFYKNLSLYKEKNITLIDSIRKEIPSYVGIQFEHICREILQKLNKEKTLPFSFKRIGKQWGKFKGEKGKNTYEVDICAINEQTKEILFGECKWQHKVSAEKVLAELKEKAGYVGWNKEERKEYYVIFAKSFNKKINEERISCFDSKDIEKELKIPGKQANYNSSQLVL